MNPSEIELIITVMRQFEALLVEETHLVENRKFKEAFKCLEEKQHLGQVYAEMSKKLFSQEEISALSCEQIEQIHSASKQLKEVLQRNAQALERAARTQELVVGIYREALKTLQKPVCYYNKQGGENRLRHSPLFVAINQEL
jgi:tRNA U34 5-carboxymethylaminomethyl modifying GTPase MnmE/TrmE